MQEKEIRSMTIEELKICLKNMGEAQFRANQIFSWLHKELVDDYDQMTNLSKGLRDKLKKEYPIWKVEEVKRFVSQIDGTTKFLFQLNDGQLIESVLMKYKHGNSVCVSSQVGCRMGCRFCASTLDGLYRNMKPGEILGQIYAIQKATGERVSNVVIMGTGEPFDNFESLLRFIELLNHEKGLNISQRGITVSTCGIVPKIYELADKELAITLAVSLHASNDTARKRLMPIANQYSILEVMKACEYYIKKTGRRITFEYGLVKGENDYEEQAKELSKLLSNMLCHVNLIPINPIKERDYEQPDESGIRKFKNLLEKNSINVTIRREMGRDIAAACGQLRRDYKNGGKE